MYKLSKPLICEKSPYFATMFRGGFREGQNDAATLKEEDGLVSVQSFGLLIEWLYTSQLHLKAPTLEEEVSLVIEFARLADMCQVEGMEMLLAEHIKALVLGNAPQRIASVNNSFFMSQHIVNAAKLWRGHPVRSIIAAASVEGYIRQDKFRFQTEVREIPGYAADLLEEVNKAVKACGGAFKEPLTAQNLVVNNIFGH